MKDIAVATIIQIQQAPQSRGVLCWHDKRLLFFFERETEERAVTDENDAPVNNRKKGFKG